MGNDLISRSAAIAIIENQRLLIGKQNLSVEYNLVNIQEKIERLPSVHDVDKQI